MLSVIMLNAVLLSVVAPQKEPIIQHQLGSAIKSYLQRGLRRNEIFMQTKRSSHYKCLMLIPWSTEILVPQIYKSTATGGQSCPTGSAVIVTLRVQFGNDFLLRFCVSNMSFHSPFSLEKQQLVSNP
jgi:hypothetical protein